MKALVYQGVGKKDWIEVPDAKIQKPTDAVVKITATTICGTDLHILKGDVPAVQEGTILGHEGVGIVTEVGDSVTNFKVGDRVVIGCVTKCGKCGYCQQNLFSHCLDDEGTSGVGWIFGHLIDGTQAEYVRVPFADNSLYAADDSISDAEGIVLSDILPTGFEIGVTYGRVKPADVVAVIGAGPVGLAAIMTAQLYSPAKTIAIDLDDNRIEKAKLFGATHGVNSGDPQWKEKVLALTDGLGVDVAIEAVGIPQTFQMCTDLVRPGGTVANAGVHGTPVELALDELWIKDIAITTGLVSNSTTPMLLNLVSEDKVPADKFVTHEFALNDILEAYDVFTNAADSGALKVLLKADG